MEKIMNVNRFIAAPVAAVVYVFPALPTLAGIGPTSSYYVLDGGNFQMAAFDSTGLQWRVPTVYGGEEFPIAVNGSIRTMQARDNGDVGGLYDLNGLPLGTTYPNNGIEAYDSTTDGTFNYLVSWNDGAVFRTDPDYSDPVKLFDARSGDLGITYDPRDDTLWIAAFNGGAITHYDLGGNVLGGFNTRLERQSALAIDYADGTLWVSDRDTGDRFVQWDKNGDFLGDFRIGVSGNWLGGEFNLPAPGALALFGVAGLVARRRRRR